MQIEQFILEKYTRLSNIQYFELNPKATMQLIVGSNGCGKAQPLDSWIKVPGGWSTMREMEVGKEVIAKDGSVTKVTGVFPQGKKQLYTITFGDGRTVRATGDHLWSVYHDGGVYPIVPKVMTTEDIITLLDGPRGHLLWIDLVDSEQSEDKPLPIDPYVLGVILGDGCVTGSIVLTHPDEFIMHKVNSRLGEGLETKVRNSNVSRCLTYSIITTRDAVSRGHNRLMLQLRDYKLNHKKSYEKFIPEEYLLGSTQQRLELLQGLMDTDGYISVRSTSSYSSSSYTLASHVAYLVRSLGGIAKISTKQPTFTDARGNRVPGRTAYIVHIRYKKPTELFTLPKKKERARDDGQYSKTLKLNIKSIELDGIEEAQCISIDHPDKLYVTDNFVVTHNSSILEELTPLPAHHSYFEKGGRKYIRVNHQSKTYALDSVYNKGSGTHSFVCEGEELNSGGTFAIQKELVEEHFKLTREIHEVLIGVTPFTQMSTAKRREWLTRLTPTDMGYAFTLYNTVKSQHRDQLGVIKHITKRMARENQDLPDDGEIVRLRQTVKDLTTQLNGLFDQRERLGEKPFADNDALRRYVTDLRRRAETLLKKRVVIPPDWGVTSQAALEGVIEQTQADVQRQQGALERMQDEYQQLQQAAPSKDDRLSPKEIDDLRQTVSDKETILAQHTKQVKAYQGLFPLVDLPIDRNPKAMLENVVHAWLDLIESFPDNPDQYFTQQKGQACRERIDRNKATYRQHDGKLNGTLQRLSRLKGCESVTCPECQHKFQPGVSQADIEGLEKAKAHHQQEMTALEAVLKDDEAYLEAYEHYVSHVNRFRRLVSETSLLAPVWHVCHQHNVMFVAPRDYRKDVLQWRDAMQTLITRDLLASEVDILKHRLRYVDAIDQSTLTHHDQRMATLTRDIETATDALRQTQTRLNDQTKCQERLQQLDNALTETINAYQHVFDQLGVQQTHYFQQALTTETEHLQLQLAQTQERLSKVTLREGILTDLNQQLDQANETYKDLGLLVKSLSPTDGLIGRYLMGFMQNVVRMMNAVIGEIWTYPMEVLPSAMEKDELNYKFPLKINDGAMTTPDIGRGSSSQRDIVNFAFKLLVMKFLRIDGVPLYLDEFGSTFDEQHRLNLIPFVNQMIELNQIQQIFFISHFSATHGAFNHADICVLDPANITVPEHYNDHVVIR